MLIELLTKRYPGMRNWLMQRLTALVMAIYVLVFVGRLLIEQPFDFIAWQHFHAHLAWRLASLVFWIALSVHAWLGVRDVFKDYVPNPNLRSTLNLLVNILLGIYMVWALYLCLIF